MKDYRLDIEGMGCAHCVRSVTQALTEIGAEVKDCRIGQADVRYDGDPSLMKDAIADRGFAVTGLTEV